MTPKKLKLRTFALPKGLDRKTAYQFASAKQKGKGDFRGLKYDPKTGKTTVI